MGERFIHETQLHEKIFCKSIPSFIQFSNFSQCAKENILSSKIVPSLRDMDVAKYSKMDLNVIFGICDNGLPTQ